MRPAHAPLLTAGAGADRSPAQVARSWCEVARRTAGRRSPPAGRSPGRLGRAVAGREVRALLAGGVPGRAADQDSGDRRRRAAVPAMGLRQVRAAEPLRVRTAAAAPADGHGAEGREHGRAVLGDRASGRPGSAWSPARRAAGRAGRTAATAPRRTQRPDGSRCTRDRVRALRAARAVCRRARSRACPARTPSANAATPRRTGAVGLTTWPALPAREPGPRGAGLGAGRRPPARGGPGPRAAARGRGGCASARCRA